MLTDALTWSVLVFLACASVAVSACHADEAACPYPFFAMDTGTKDASHESPASQAEMLKELGYDGTDHTGAAADLLDKVADLDKRGLRLFAIYNPMSIDPDTQPYDPVLEEVIPKLAGRETVIWAALLSKRYQTPSAEGDEHAAKVLNRLADLGSGPGIRVAIYPHTGFYVARVEDALRLAEKVNRPNVGVTFNLCHWLRVEHGENLRPLLARALPRLFMVTINGADSGGEDWKQLIQTLDRGTYDTRAFVAVLQELGYSGPIGLQGYGIGGDVHDNLRRSMDTWRSWWPPLPAQPATDR